MENCGYKHLGGCSESITHRVRNYFRVARKHLLLCGTHAKEYAELHPFERTPEKIPEQRKVS